jgi:hypothetical protein
MSSDKSTSLAFGDGGLTRRPVSTYQDSSRGRQASGRSSFVMGGRNLPSKKVRESRGIDYAYSDSPEYGSARAERKDAPTASLLSRGAIVHGVASVVGGDKVSQPFERFDGLLLTLISMIGFGSAERWSSTASHY